MEDIPLQEKIKENKKITIQTHDGKFHADDVASVSLLLNYFSNKGYDINLIRSRHKNKKSDIYVDVGGEYDPSKNKYDHHHCTVTFNDKTYNPLSSVGMIWKHFGKEILELFLKSKRNEYNEKCIEDLYNEIYFKLIQDIDSNDNGFRNDKKWSHLSFPSIISSINSDSRNKGDQDENFKIAVSLCSTIFEIKFTDIIKKYYSHIEDIEYTSRLLKEHRNKEYLVVPEYIPTIFKCLNKLDPNYQIKFLVFCNEENFTIRTRYKEPFQSIKNLCPEDMLKQTLNDSDELIFIHKNLFIAKTTTLETALEIIKLSMEFKEENNPPEPQIYNKYKFLSILSLGIIGYFIYKNQ